MVHGGRAGAGVVVRLVRLRCKSLGGVRRRWSITLDVVRAMDDVG